MSKTKEQISGRSQWENLLEDRLDYKFRDRQLLTHALMHTTWANEHGMEGLNNERLEFLGDAVLELCVTDELYCRYPALREGELTNFRSSLVNEAALAQIGREIGLDRAILLGKGEEKNAGREKDSIIGDAFEALLAAIFKDGGFEGARSVVRRVYSDKWPIGTAANKATVKKDSKTRLQEICHRLFKKTPVYSRLDESGPEHEKLFKVKLTLPDGREFFGMDKSAKMAEHTAAALAISALEKED